jgi:hypothetical protein
MIKRSIWESLLGGPRNLRQAERFEVNEHDAPKVKICHFSFHKNLTVYYSNVATEFSARTDRSYKHFNSYVDRFHASTEIDLRSVNNHFISLDAIQLQSPGTAFSLFIRDPRDLVVSGYFYHKRGAESWCTERSPTEQTLETVNLKLPSEFLRGSESISECLQRLDIKDGISMEIEMRRPHFESMRKWSSIGLPQSDLVVLKYEDIIQDEMRAFSILADHYSLSDLDRRIWLDAAEKYRAKNVRTTHIRNPAPRQWDSAFSQQHINWFYSNFSDVLEFFNYHSS